SDVMTHPDPRLRRLAIEALAGFGRENTRALAVLIKALADSDQLVRYVAAQTLFRLNVDRRLGASHRLAIMAGAPAEGLEVLMRAQGGAQDADIKVLSLLGSEDPKLRAAAAFVLLGSPDLSRPVREGVERVFGDSMTRDTKPKMVSLRWNAGK